MAGRQNGMTSLPLVAIDIAKDWNILLVEAPDGERRSFKVANCRSDHDELVGFLRGLPGHVRVALEPTGDFHRPLAFRLLSEGFEVVGVSSVAQARFREARFGTWDKNDPKDAQVILEMLKQGVSGHEAAFLTLRSMSDRRGSAAKESYHRRGVSLATSQAR